MTVGKQRRLILCPPLFAFHAASEQRRTCRRNTDQVPRRQPLPALQRGGARASRIPQESTTELVGMAPGAPAQPLASVTMPVPQRRCKTLQGGPSTYAATMIGYMSLLCHIQHDSPTWVSSILDK